VTESVNLNNHLITWNGKYKMHKLGRSSSKIYCSRQKTRNIDDSTISELVYSTESDQYEDGEMSWGALVIRLGAG